jgi:hypothetical protein
MAKPTPKPAKAASASTNKKERTYLSQSDVPSYSIVEALRIPQAIRENYGNGPVKPLEVAKALNVTPTSSTLKMLTGASIAYGFTEGGWNAAQIALTPLALKILKPKTETDTLDGKREALLKPRVIREFLQKYADNAIPREDIALNILEDMGVPKERTSEVLKMILQGAESVGFLEDIKGKPYVNLKGTAVPLAGEPPEAEAAHEGEEQQGKEAEVAVPRPGNPVPVVPKASADIRLGRVFLSHGKNREFIEPIKALLKFGNLEGVVTAEKYTVSLPVPQKVMDDMRSCGAAIIHVDGERKLLDEHAKEVVVLNENVLIEIGVSQALYGQRFILLVKEGVKLPSNLQGIFEVRYIGDKLDADETIKLLHSINDMKTKPLPG